MVHWSRVVRYAWLVTQRVVCIVFLQVIAPALLHRGISSGRGPVQLAPWLYLAATLNVTVPGFRRYFRYTGLDTHHYTHDIFQIVLIWCVFRFVWQPFTRLLDFAALYFQLPSSSDDPFVLAWSLTAACVCYMTALYYGDLIGMHYPCKDSRMYSDSTPDVYYLPIPKDSVKVLLAGLQEHIPNLEHRSNAHKCRSESRRQVGIQLVFVL